MSGDHPDLLTVTITEREVAALRVLRTFSQAALNRAADELVALGKQHELTQSLDALAAIDRLTGDEASEPSREELQLEAIRAGTAAGFRVSFYRDGSVHFERQEPALEIGDLLDMEPGTIAEWIDAATSTEPHARR